MATLFVEVRSNYTDENGKIAIDAWTTADEQDGSGVTVAWVDPYGVVTVGVNSKPEFLECELVKEEIQNVLQKLEVKLMAAEYVSVWDGSEEIRTPCKFNNVTKTVSDVVASNDVEGLEILEEEYVELLDGTIIKDFTTEEGVLIVDGVSQDSE